MLDIPSFAALLFPWAVIVWPRPSTSADLEIACARVLGMFTLGHRKVQRSSAAKAQQLRQLYTVCGVKVRRAMIMHAGVNLPYHSCEWIWLFHEERVSCAFDQPLEWKRFQRVGNLIDDFDLYQSWILLSITRLMDLENSASKQFKLSGAKTWMWDWRCTLIENPKIHVTCSAKPWGRDDSDLY